MTDTAPNYTPGDIANGHVLGEDGTWQALPPSGPTPEQPSKKPFFKRRWVQVVGGGIAVIWAISALTGGGNNADKPASAPTTTEQTSKPEPKAKDADATPAPETPAPKPTPTQAPAAPEYDLTVDAGTLIKAFENNELAADAKYDGKTLKVTGVVDKIDTEIFGDDYILDLTNGSQFAFLTVSVYDIPKDDLATIHKGQHVTVIADFDDGGDLGVTMKHGHLA